MASSQSRSSFPSAWLAPLVVGPAAAGTQITVTDAVAIGNDLNEEFGDDAQGARSRYI